MKWTKIEIDLNTNQSLGLHFPPNGRNLVSRAFDGNCDPVMFQRKDDGKTINAPPAVIYGGKFNTLSISGIGNTGTKVVESLALPLMQKLKDLLSSKESGQLRFLSGEYPQELYLHDFLVTYRIPRLIVSTKDDNSKERWFDDPGKKKDATSELERFFADKLIQLNIDTPENLIIGDVAYERSVPIKLHNRFELALVNLTFRTNANLELMAGTPWHLGKYTSYGFGVVVNGGRHD